MIIFEESESTKEATKREEQTAMATILCGSVFKQGGSGNRLFMLLFQSRPTGVVPLPDTRGCRAESFNFKCVLEQLERVKVLLCTEG